MNFIFYENNNIITFIIGGVFSSIFSSFYSLLFYRIPKKQSINGRSKCICGRTLPINENLPIIGYIYLKGYSSCCNAKIPLHFFILELLSFFIGGILLFYFDYKYLIYFLITYGIITIILANIRKMKVLE